MLYVHTKPICAKEIAYPVLTKAFLNPLGEGSIYMHMHAAYLSQWATYSIVMGKRPSNNFGSSVDF